MASNPSESRSPPPGGLQSMLARLRGMVQALRSPGSVEPDPQECMPTWDGPAGAVARPAAEGLPAQALPVAEAIEETPVLETIPSDGTPADPSIGDASAPEPAALSEPISQAFSASPPDLEEKAPATPAPQLCPYCQAPRADAQVYCDNCGWIFPAVAKPAVQTPAAEVRLKDRYVLAQRLADRGECVRFRGYDHGSKSAERLAVTILRAPLPEAGRASTASEDTSQAAAVAADQAEAVQSSDESGSLLREAKPADRSWPRLGWERMLLQEAAQPVFPQILDQFAEDGFEYLIEELPAGRLLWDAWDDPDASGEDKFGWLVQIAEALQRLHEVGAMLEGLRPDIVVVRPDGQARVTDLADLLPLPLPANPPIRATPYTAPELILSSERADARADLYSFGAMLYALYLGRELTELDFELQGVPKSFLQRFPNVHPLLGRLISKTCCRDLEQRFPTEEAAKSDPTGFAELLHTLDTCRRAIDQSRLEIAAWTTTGMVRTGNEDAFALLHAVESREDSLGDSALVLLADGMGGYEAGEIAASMAIQVMRQYLVEQRPFAALSGQSAFQIDTLLAGDDPTKVARDGYKRLLAAALKEANKQVYHAAHNGIGRRGMGCTAEVVYVNGRHLIVGHVGDSRTYHLRQGNLIQVSRDQTWVNRMVEIGALTPEEADNHPRRSELQQAIGGHAEVNPEVYDATLKAGDWVVVCSDGLSNHIPPATLKELLLAAGSAETAARRLVNQVNLAGATDNATVVVVRAT